MSPIASPLATQPTAASPTAPVPVGVPRFASARPTPAVDHEPDAMEALQRLGLERRRAAAHRETAEPAPGSPAGDEVERVLGALQATTAQLDRTRRSLELFIAEITRIPAGERPATRLPTVEDVRAMPDPVPVEVAEVRAPLGRRVSATPAEPEAAPAAPETPVDRRAARREQTPGALTAHLLDLGPGNRGPVVLPARDAAAA